VKVHFLGPLKAYDTPYNRSLELTNFPTPSRIDTLSLLWTIRSDQTKAHLLGVCVTRNLPMMTYSKVNASLLSKGSP
jgi:hypothetical protein